MRAIRFKGKRPENGEWVYGSFYEDGDVAYMFGHCLDESQAKNIAFSVDLETVCQFTGFRDKNYKNISLARYLAVERKRGDWTVFIKYRSLPDHVLIRHIQHVHELQHILWVLGLDAELKI